MKTMVKLAVLVTILLLLAGVAFATGTTCNCYEYSYTDLDRPEFSSTSTIDLCFNFGDNSGTQYAFCGGGELSLFFDGMIKQALLYSTSPDSSVGSLKFHGEMLHAFNGIFYCYPDRFILHGYKIHEGKCADI